MKRKITLIITACCFMILSNSCASDDSGNDGLNHISLKVGNAKKTMWGVFVTETTGIVAVHAELMSFDNPTEIMEFDIDTNGGDHSTLTNFTYQNTSGEFFAGGSFVSSATINPVKRTITGTMSGIATTSDTSVSIAISNGSFSINY